ncbi:hypothetical protein PspLS_06857 [Pyricularia sp. CBS 133598]|nr:hypothetical protein PspLS_06857 [Pyricularia sp. CBS 133598]
MRIGCLQFAPQVGDVDNNLNRADSVLNRADPRDLDDLDLLVLPEMAFSGYNFKSLQEIKPFLEPKGSGISALWARTTALKYDCKVAVGYPEIVNSTTDWTPTSQYFNSLLLVSEEGETLANYRKQHLYYTDETWCAEGTGGFFQGEVDGIGRTAMGICKQAVQLGSKNFDQQVASPTNIHSPAGMDINPYKFEAPWHQFEFAFHILESHANVVIISMAWSTLEGRAAFCSKPYEPDMETLEYWAKRMEPLIRAEREDEIILIFANRCGIERDALYAGTSAVMGIQNGEVNVYGVLGRGTKHLLVVDTDNGPFAKLVSRPGRDTAEGEWDGTTTDAEVQAGDSRSPADDDLDNFLDLNKITDPVSYRPSAPVQVTPVECALYACVPEVPEEAEEAEEAAKQESAGPTKQTEPLDKPTNDEIADWAMEIDGKEPAPSEPAESFIDLPRADSPILSPVRPRLTISTATSPATPVKNPRSSDFGTFPAAPPHDLDTPPPTGEFPDQEYLEAAAQVDRLLFSATALHTPEEPDWPLPDASAVSRSRSQSPLRSRSPLDLKPLPLPPPLEGDKPLPLRPQERLSPVKNSFRSSPVKNEFTIPLPISPASVPEDAPLPEEQSRDSQGVPHVQAQLPLTTILAPESISAIASEMPLVLARHINPGYQRRDSGISEPSISIEVESRNKETVVVHLRDQTPSPSPPRSVTITFSIGTAL